MAKWTKGFDGIWPRYTSPDLRIWVSQFGRNDWRWTIYRAHAGSMKLAEGQATSAAKAKAQALEFDRHLKAQRAA